MDKILVVEDNTELSDDLSRNLQAEGLEVYAAASLAQARKYLVRDDAQDMVQGLSIGADDYVTKPFRTDVLVARIRAVLRRVRNCRQEDDSLYCGDICINRKASKVYRKDCPVELTPNEYQLLLLLLEHKNQTVTREQILGKLWDMEGDYVNDNTLTTLVKRLRQKVEEHPQMPKLLLTVRGFGYKAVDYEG